MIIMFAITFLSNNSYAQKIEKFFLKGKYDKAEEYCQKYKGDKGSIYFELAEAYYKISKYKKAAIAYQKSNKEKTGLKKIQNHYLSKFNFDSATIYCKMLNDKDCNLINKDAANYYLEKKEYSKAIKYASKGSFPSILQQIGNTYTNREKIDSAAICFSLISDKSLKEKLFKKLSTICFDKKHLSSSLQFAQKTDPINKKNLINKIGNSYLKKQQYDSAASCYKLSDSKYGMNKIGDIFFKKGDYKKAQEYYSILGDSLYVKDLMANRYLENDKYEMAFKLFESIGKKGEGSLKIAENLLKNKNFEVAAKYYAYTDKPKVGYRKVAAGYLESKTLNRERAEYYYAKSIENPTESKVDSLLHNDRLKFFPYWVIAFNKRNNDRYNYRALIGSLATYMLMCQKDIGRNKMLAISNNVNKLVFDEASKKLFKGDKRAQDEIDGILVFSRLIADETDKKGSLLKLIVSIEKEYGVKYKR